MGVIHFSLEEPTQDHLVIALSVAGEGRRRVLYKEYLETFRSQKEVLKGLMGAELAYQNLSPLSAQAETTPFNRVHIPSKKGAEVLEELLRGGWLYYKGRALTYASAMAAPLHVEVRGSGKQVVVSGVVGGRPVAECEWLFLAEAAWIVSAGVLQKVRGSVDRIYWNLVYPISTELSGRRMEALLDRIEEERPPYVSVVLEEVVGVAPLPVLQLADRQGTCANLWLDYGEGRGISFHDPRTPEWRQRGEEGALERDLLESGYARKVIEEAHYFCSPGKVCEVLTFLIEMGWRVEDKEGSAVVLCSKSLLEFERKGEEIAVSGRVDFSGAGVDFSSVVRAYQGGESLLPLSEGVVGLIDRARIEKEWGALAREPVIRGQVTLKRMHFGLLAALPDVPEEVCPRLAHFVEVEPGEEFVGRLHPYQRVGLSYLSFLHQAGFHGLLADEMGLGKTVQVLALFSRLGKKGPHLVVAPTSLLFNWRQEAERFLPKMDVLVHAGPDRARSPEAFAGRGVVITSYALLRLDWEILSKVAFECVVLDEAHTIRNPRSQVTQAAYRLRGAFRLALTGTPLLNSLEDVHSLFRFLIPNLLERGDPVLHEKVAPFTLRRTKGEVAKDLPEKIEQTLYVEMAEGQAALYEEVLTKSREGLLKKIAADGAEAHRMEILEVILRLRQICCHPQLFDPASEATSGKLDALLLDIEEMHAQGSKVIVYSQFTSMLKRIREELEARSLATLYLDGGTKDREAVVSAFQNDPEKQLFLCSLKAGGVGLNLQRADYVLLFDPWWNVAIEEQAIGRAHRLGREGVLIAKRYLTPGTVEEKMEGIKKTKTLMGLGPHMPDQLMKQMTTQDLTALLDPALPL